MSIRTVSVSPPTSNAGLNTKSLQGAISPTPWVRNPQWLTLPTVLSSEQKMVGLHAIFPSSNFLALVAAGDYTVNWGDGVTENFTANTVAYHEYDYTNAAFNGTLTDAGYKQAIVTVTPQAGQSLTYLNLNQKHNQTNLQAYASGFLDITVSSANLTDLRVGVNIPSSTAGDINFSLLEQFNLVNSNCKQLNSLFANARRLQNIVNFVTSAESPIIANVTYTDVGDVFTLPAHGFVNGNSLVFKSATTADISFFSVYYVINATLNTFQLSTTYAGSSISLTADGSGVVAYGTTSRFMFFNCFLLKTLPLFDTVNVVATQSMFSTCTALTTVPPFNTINVVNMSSMFQNCAALITVPLFNTVNVVNIQDMFNSCLILQSVPLFNTVNVTNFTQMFSGCAALEFVPLFNTSNAENLFNWFLGCRSLKTVPLFNTSKVTTMGQMFQNCTALLTVPLFNTANVTSMGVMFRDCASLQSVPLFNTANVTNMGSMFNGCRSLKTVPLFNTVNVTSSLNATFFNCTALVTVPLFNTANVTNMGNMFNGCSNLSNVPGLVTTSVTSPTSFANMFSNCSSLTRIEAKNFRFSFSVANCKLSATALNEIYTNLPTVTGQTITVSGNYGTATDDPTIATAKGWTVSG